MADSFNREMDHVLRERCPVCGSTQFYNNVVLRSGHHARVFVECAQCGKLVARYILHAYIDPNYDYGSTLKQIRLASHYGDSMRNLVEDLKPHQDRAKTQFSEIIQLRKEKELQVSEKSNTDSEERIMELIFKYNVKEDG